MKSSKAYFLRLEIWLAGFAAVLAALFYVSGGPLVAATTFLGGMAAVNFGLLWIFKDAVRNYFRRTKRSASAFRR